MLGPGAEEYGIQPNMLDPAPVMDHPIARELEASAREASSLLSALGNDNRLMILCHLVQGEKRVSELVALVGLSQSALSQHLSKMRSLRLIESRREGQSIYYRIASSEALQVLETLHDIYCAKRRD